MMVVEALDIEGHKIQAHFDKTPDECPVCHRGIAPISGGRVFVSASLHTRDWSGYLEILHRCPKLDCARAFIAIYRQHIQNTGDRNWFFLEQLVPSEFEPPFVEDSIDTVSPAFVTIYGQALEAERLRLDQVCGPALRRALEFLIKDYLIQKRPSEADHIKKTFLGACIENYVTDTNIKACSKRATWLGNDETHYERKYNQHDIQHLKELIRLTMYWMASELLTEKYNVELTKK